MYNMNYNHQPEELDLENLGREFGLTPKFQVKPPRYNNDEDDDEEEEEEEEEEEDDDLGPETNVDAGDDACAAYEKLQRENAMMQAMIDIKKPAASELVAEADNVADSEDSEDEWNFYRPGAPNDKAAAGGPCDAEEAAAAAAAAACVRAGISSSGGAASSQPHDDENGHNDEYDVNDVNDDDDDYGKDNPVLREKKPESDQCEGDNESSLLLPPSQQSTSPEPSSSIGNFAAATAPLVGDSDNFTPAAHDDYEPEYAPRDAEAGLEEKAVVAEAAATSRENGKEEEEEREQQQKQQEEDEAEQEDVTAEFDELHETLGTKEPRESEQQQRQLLQEEEQQLELKETDTEAEVDTLPEEDYPLDQYQQKLEYQRESEDTKLEEPELVFENKENNSELDDDMEYHLNPEAAEFVPTANSPTSLPKHVMNSDLISGSPLKKSILALQNNNMPSEEEFKNEISHRPSDLDDSFSDYSNDETMLQKNALEDCEKDDGEKFILNLDESEISSTKAEFGDESTANFSMASEFYKTGLSGVDCSYSSERGDFDAMATSMTPGDFKAAFEQDLDLNKVHELKDEDLTELEAQNGKMDEGEDDEDEKMPLDKDDLNENEDGIVKIKFDLDMEKIVPQQQENAELFSSVIEERESDNKDLFMNMRNVEQGYEMRHNNDQQNESDFIETTINHSEALNSTENAHFGDFSSEDLSTYAKNNPFASNYQATAVPVSDDSLQNLNNHMENLALNDSESKQAALFENHTELLTPEDEAVKESEERRESQAEIMQNPLDLNFGPASAEQKIDEPLIVSPTKELEVMNSKFEEENLMSQAAEADLGEFNKQQDLAQELCFKSNHLAEFSSDNGPLPENKEATLVEENINVRVSLLQEYTFEKESSLVEGLKASASPVEEITSTLSSTDDFLKRNSINVSDPLQELDKFEDELNLKTHEVKDNISTLAPQILKENLVDEQKDVEEIATPSATETKLEEISALSNEPSLLTNEPPAAITPLTTLESTETITPAATTATAVAAAAAVAATAATVAATKATIKTDTTAKSSSKPAPASKTASKSTPSASPTKSTATSASKTSATAKRPATGLTAAKPKSATGTTTSKTASNNLLKTNTTAKTPSAPRTTTLAAKATPRTAASTTTAKARTALSIGSTAKTISASTAEKKTLANGTAKPIAKSSSAAAGTAAKTGPVRSAASRLSMGPSTTAAPKPRATSAASAKTASAKTAGAATNGTAASRPKTAPLLGSSAASKTKAGAGAMSPIIDKQIKETANKQISSARNAASTVSKTTRLSSAGTLGSTGAATTAAKRVSLVQKQSMAAAAASAAAAAASPTKKPAPIQKPGAKTNAVPRTNAKLTSTTKNGTTAPAKVVQNGVCDSQDTKISTTTTTRTTSNIEEDIPKKDVSPIEPITDNQLITAE